MEVRRGAWGVGAWGEWSGVGRRGAAWGMGGGTSGWLEEGSLQRAGWWWWWWWW